MQDQLNQPVIVDAVRTAFGRSHPQKGVFRDVRSDDLAAACIRALMARTGLDPAHVEDVVFGCSKPTRQQGTNVARLIALMAGLPESTPGTTVNRLCGSGLQALHQAAHSILAGAEDVQIVGGLEHMQHLPMGMDVDLNPRLFHRTSKYALQMGLVAEHLAQMSGITRRQQDAFAERSHRLAAEAGARGFFEDQIIPVMGRGPDGALHAVTADQTVRPETNIDILASLPPAFAPHGTVTAGNSSPISDGAAAMLVMSRRKAAELGLTPLASIRATAVVATAPSQMGLAPVAAVKKALVRAGIDMPQVQWFELNEAFAVQVIACVEAMRIAWERVNVHGGAIAIGHPLGASGIRLASTLTRILTERDGQFGVAAMCIGMGQGIATVLERC